MRFGGAASLGAIRAAGCALIGMIGLGGIWKEYASVRRTSDADIMLCHARVALEYAPVSLSLVDCGVGLRALPANVLPLAEATAPLARAWAQHFTRRSGGRSSRRARPSSMLMQSGL